MFLIEQISGSADCYKKVPRLFRRFTDRIFNPGPFRIQEKDRLQSWPVFFEYAKLDRVHPLQ